MKGMNILLIDDDTEEHEIFQEALTNIPGTFFFTALTNPVTTLQKLIQKQLTPDLIFLDLNMQFMSGQQFLLEIKKKKEISTIPVFIYSTTAHQKTIDLTIQLGAQGFITKPDNIKELINLLIPIFGNNQRI
jgi:CheY-like chemotaxis protein